MFENIGNKIKVLAKVICILGMVASFISGISVLISVARLASYGADEYVPLGLLFFIIIVAVGSLISWIGCFKLYAFGELVQSNKNIEHYCKQINQKLLQETNFVKNTSNISANIDECRICKNCGNKNEKKAVFCVGCGKRL